MSNPLTRLNIIIDTLKLRGAIRNQSDIAYDLQYKRPGTISEIVNGKVPITDKFLQAFCLYYGVNKDYIIDGLGDPFDKNYDFTIIKKMGKSAGQMVAKEDQEINIYSIDQTVDMWPGVPMYDTPVTAGTINLIRNDFASKPSYYLQIPSFNDCTFGARASGDSMHPEIRNGDYIVCRELQSMDSVIYGDIYLVVTNDGMETVKYVHPHEEREDWIKLVGHNKSIPTTPMPKSNIFKVYKVKGVLKGY